MTSDVKELVERLRSIIGWTIRIEDSDTIEAAAAALEALTRDRAREQEPVAWMDPANMYPELVTFDRAVVEKWPHIYRQPLYTHPPDTATIRRQALEEVAAHLKAKAEEYAKHGNETAAYCWLMTALSLGSLATAGGQND